MLEVTEQGCSLDDAERGSLDRVPRDFPGYLCLGRQLVPDDECQGLGLFYR